MQVSPDNSPKSEYLPDQIHSDQVPTWPIVQNLSEYLMPNAGSRLLYGELMIRHSVYLVISTQIKIMHHKAHTRFQ
jgi:hypothetical protein